MKKEKNVRPIVRWVTDLLDKGWETIEITCGAACSFQGGYFLAASGPGPERRHKIAEGQTEAEAVDCWYRSKIVIETEEDV